MIEKLEALFKVWKLGQHINCKKLSQEAERFLLTVPLLNKFWESEQSLEMDMELVTSTLDSDKLICESEDQAEGSYKFFFLLQSLLKFQPCN